MATITSVEEITIPLGAAIAMDVTVGRKTLGLELLWNTRTERWIFNVRDQFGNPIVVGTTVLADIPILGLAVDSRLPVGDFIALTGDGIPPGRNDWGARAHLVYVESTP